MSVCCNVRWVGLVIAVVLGFGEARATDLLDLYVQALELDPRFQTARLQLQIAQEGIRESRSGLLPNLSGTALNVWVDQDILSSDSLLFTEGRTNYRNRDASISLTQPLYRSAAMASVKQAKSGVRQSGFELAVEEQDLIYRVAEAHFDYLSALDDLESAGAEKNAIQRQLAEAEERFQSGLGAITPVQEDRAQFALAEASEIEAGVALEVARRAIAEITGSVPADLKSLGETFPLETIEPANVESWVQTARFQNPRIKALEARADGLQHDLRRERNAARIPTLDLVGTYVDSDNSGTEFGGGRHIVTSNYGFRLNVPIYDGGRGSAVVRARRLRINQATQAIELELRRVERETREAFHTLQGEIVRAEALRKAVFSQEAVLAEKRELLRAGLRTSFEVLDATRELYSAQRDLAHSRYRYILSRLRLIQSTGTLGIDDLRRINAYMQ